MTTKPDIETVAKRIAHRLFISGETVTGAQLAHEFGLADSQQVRECIHWARCQGDPQLSRIAASSSGYFWTSDKETALETVHGLRGRAFSMFDAAKGIAKSFGVHNMDQEALPL